MKKNPPKKPLSNRKRKTWQLQEAKAKFSQLVNEVLEEGYQTITKNGRPVVIVLSLEEFEKLKAPESSLGKFLLSDSPFSKSDLAIERDKETGREIDL